MFDVYVIESKALIVGRPNGIRYAISLERIFDFIEIKEQQLETVFNRCCDLSRLKESNSRLPKSTNWSLDAVRLT